MQSAVNLAPLALTRLVEVEIVDEPRSAALRATDAPGFNGPSGTIGSAPTTWTFLDPDSLTLGGAQSAADVRLPGDDPSAVYAALRRHGDSYALHTLQPGAQLRVGGQPLEALPLPLSQPTELRLGGQRCALKVTRVVPFSDCLITGRLGRGGMAEVYLARQTGPGGFDRPVVLKLIRTDTRDAIAAAGDMLLDEARIAAQIAHPNVVHIYRVGAEHGVQYIAMEYVRGVTLLDLQIQLDRLGVRPPPDLAAALMAQVCTGLHAAHELRRDGRLVGVVHRDVSPSNIMVTPEGQVKVIDFGIASAEARLQAAGAETGLKGKPSYMSPEQASQAPMDRRADLFSAAVVLYELVSGQRLFQRPTLSETLLAICHAPISPLQTVCPAAPPALCAAIHAALERDPARRPPTAAALAEALLEVVQQHGGRYAGPSGLARGLRELGLTLEGRPVTPLSEVPPPLRPSAQVRLLPAGSADERVDLGGRTLLLYAREVDPRRPAEPLRLPLCDVPGLLPAELWLQQHASALCLLVFGAEGSRAGLYLDASDPRNRLDRFYIDGGAGDVTLGLGSRRGGVRPVRCQWHSRDGGAGVELQLDGLPVRLRAPAAARQLLVVSTRPPDDDTLYAACISIL